MGSQDTATLTITDDETPSGPVRIEAEDYVAYFDTTAGNAGGEYRNDDVDIYTTTDASGFYVGGIRSGEWMEYTVTLPGMPPGSYGNFDAVVRVVSTKSLSHSIDLEIDGQTQTFNFSKTGNSWDDWVDITLEDLVLPAGEQTIRLTMNSTKFNFNYLEFIPTEPAAPSPGEIALDSSLFLVDEDAGTATITLRRTGGDDGEVSAELNLMDGSAVNPADYTHTSPYIVTFGDGVTTQTVTIPIVDDTIDEGNETINIALSNVTGGAMLGSQDTATLAIQDNDAPPGSGPIRIMPLGDSITLDMVRIGMAMVLWKMKGAIAFA
ncbi:MAG: carbohydrate-binding protein [Okeania sp. SIO2H7]|nr:carbohydrate-binding protein [Okeania sp. SIO2H7]